MPEYLDLTPLDEEGMRSDRPSWEVKWKRLENVIFMDGSIRMRPGFRNVQMALELETTYTPCPAVALPVIRHPGTSITGRESGPSAIDTIIPTVTTANSTWAIVGGAGSVHASIDEQPPDNDTTYIHSTTVGDTFTVTFGNPATSYGDIAGILLRGRARAFDSGGDDDSLSDGKLQLNINGTDVEIPETSLLVISAGDYTADTAGAEVETLFWEDFTVWLPNNPATDKRWTRGNVNDFTVKMTNDSESTAVPSGAFFPFAADGVHTDWGILADINNARLLDASWDGTVIEPSAVGQKQSFVTAADPFGGFRGPVNSITGVQFRVGCIGPNVEGTTADIEIFHRGTDGVERPLLIIAGSRYLVPNEIIGARPVEISDINERAERGRLLPLKVASNVADVQWRDYRRFDSVILTENPETELAWTESDLQGAEFGITFAAGDAAYPPGLVKADVVVAYTGADASAIDITYMVADVYGFTAGSTLSDAPVDRIWFGTHAAFRLDNEAADTATAIAFGWTDVTGSIPDLTTPGVVPLDWAVLFGQIFVVNGKQNTFFYPNGSDQFDQLADNTTGKTVASFADRLLVGWVKDGVSGNITPERIAHSARNDATDWTGVLAGDFDLIQTPGGVVKLLPLTEDICVAYKEQGIYNIRQTGNFVAPLTNDLIDRDMECLSMASVVATVSENGTPYHIFLGRNPTSGISVFGYDGQTIIDLGKPIARNLATETDFNMLPYAHAAVDPQTNSYWLFVTNFVDAATNAVDASSPDNSEGVPKTAWVMDLRTGSWTRAVMPFNITTSEHWPLSLYTPNKDAGISGNAALGRLGPMSSRLILGNLRTLTPSYADLDITYDEFRDAAATTRERDDAITGSDFNRTELVRKGIYVVIETGDYRLSEAYLHNILYRVHLYGPNKGAVELLASTSVTGGTDYSTYHQEQMGSPAAENSYLHTVIELDGMEGRRHRVQIVYQPLVDVGPGILDIHEMILQFEGAGDNP